MQFEQESVNYVILGVPLGKFEFRLKWTERIVLLISNYLGYLNMGCFERDFPHLEVL